ncbi:MAG TPA: ABC transporter ATP-binding protein [Fluviicola sp.]|nr:ABC transporter ATP-binding protein [Fluviicola sp.]
MKNVSPFHRLKELLKLDKSIITKLYLYAIFSGIVSLSLPLGIQSVIYYIQAGQITTSWIVLIFLVIGGVVLSGALQIMQLRITETLQQRIYVRYSFDFAYRFPRINRQRLKGRNPSELMNRFFDVISLQKGISKVLLELFSAFLLIVFSLTVLCFYHPFFILFSIVLVAIVFIVFRPIMRRGIDTSLAESKHKYKTAFWLQEIARGDWSFRLASKGNHSLERLDRHAGDYLCSRESHFKVLWTQYLWMIALKSLAVAALLGLGGYLVINQQMNLGQFVAAEILILLILGGVEKIIQLLETVYDVFTSLEKLGQVQDLPLVFDHAETDFPADDIFPVHLMENRGENAVEVLEIQQAKHQIITGIGEHLSGLMLRCLVDTTVSDRFTPHWNNTLPSAQMMADAFDDFGWYTPLAYVFEGTVMDNVILGRASIGGKELVKALETVGMANRVRSLTPGNASPMNKEVFDTCEIQRLLLARAIVHAPALLIASFYGSALDETEQEKLLQNISSNYPGTTIICAAAKPFQNLKWKVTDLSEKLN